MSDAGWLALTKIAEYAVLAVMFIAAFRAWSKADNE